MSEEYLAAGNLHEAVKTIKEIFRDHESKEAFLATIAEIHFKKCDIKEVVKIIKEIFRDHKTKEAFLEKIAEKIS
jgi:hypothetical protein